MPERRYYETTRPSLLCRVRDASDQQSWREFEVRYGNLIFQYCQRRGLQPCDCDDVRQMVWVNLAKGLRNFEYDPKAGRFRDYLGRVVKNAIVRFFSRKDPVHRALDTGVLATTSDDDAGQDESWEQEWVDHHYRLAMQTIEQTFEPRSVSVFKRLLSGDGVDVVAGAFGMNVQAVHQIKYRIKARMQVLIARQIREEDEPETPTT